MNGNGSGGSAGLKPRAGTLKSAFKPSGLLTSLPSGEKLPKTHKVFAAVGVLEEVIGHLARIKAVYFNFDESSSRRMFTFARLTKIQEDLQSIIKSITTSPKNNGRYLSTRFSQDRVNDLENAMLALNAPPFTGVPGNTQIEADLYCLWAVTRRAERQLHGARDFQTGLNVDLSVEHYINLLAKYIQCLITQMGKRTAVVAPLVPGGGNGGGGGLSLPENEIGVDGSDARSSTGGVGGTQSSATNDGSSTADFELTDN